MAGVAGFEPTHAGSRDRSLTAWPHPKIWENLSELVGMKGLEPPASCSQGRRASQTAPHPDADFRPSYYMNKCPFSQGLLSNLFVFFSMGLFETVIAGGFTGTFTLYLAVSHHFAKCTLYGTDTQRRTHFSNIPL